MFVFKEGSRSLTYFILVKFTGTRCELCVKQNHNLFKILTYVCYAITK
jgi:hypothetical protein